LSPAAEQPAARDAGATLVEVLVAMTIFVTLLSVVMASVIGVSRGAVRSQNASTTATEIRRTFSTLDKQVRYADAVNAAGTTLGGDWWVEFRAPGGAAGGTPTCIQWRFRPATGEVQTRSWPESAAASSAAWSTVVTGGAEATTPFTMLETDGANTMQRLTVALSADRGAGASSELRTTFVARNSTPDSLGNQDIGNDGVSDNPVCARDASRA